MKKTLLSATFAASVLGLVAPAQAADFDKRPYLSPMYQHTFDEGERQSNNGKGWYLGSGVPLNQFWNVELGASSQRYPGGSPAGAGTFWREVGLELDGLFFYNRNRSFSPYAAFGGGWSRVDVMNTGVEDDAPTLNAGFGFMSMFDVAGHDVGLRADARYRVAFLDEIKDASGIDTLSEPVVRVGLVVPIGAKAAAAPVAVAAAATAPKVLDSDGDGVPDEQDKCPGSAKGAMVDGSGCSKDQMKAGAERKFDDVLFDFDKSTLSSAGMSILDNAAQVVNSGEYKSLAINVSGHTDAIGTEGYNQALSERRANVVKAYLVKKGVDAARIRTFAYGESQPVADNKTEAGRALNRRSEVRTTKGE